MNVDPIPFTEKMIERVTALLGECAIGRSRIERVLSEDAPRLQRMAQEAERLAAGGWGHSAFRVEVERVTREWAAAVRAQAGAQLDEALGEVG